MTESLLVRRILLAYGRTPTVRLFRNSVGVGRGLNHPGTITYGLAVGSPDIVGWATRHGTAVFVGIECKTPAGRQELREKRPLRIR